MSTLPCETRLKAAQPCNALYPEGCTEDLMAKRLTLTTLTTLAFLSLTLGAQWIRQATASPQSQPSTASAQQPSPSRMQDMMKMHEQMMAEMRAGNAKLEELVKHMNAAKGEAKVD